MSAHPHYLDQTGKLLTYDQAEVSEHYLPLARSLLELPWRDSRQVIAIAGPPGSGKSSFAALLSLTINMLCRREISIVVGQDGWHYSNLWLSSHVVQSGDRLVALRQIKGAPETFDVDGLLAWLRQLKTKDEASFPIYSREQHDPLPDAGRIKPGHHMILIEGNYLLLDRPGWREIQALAVRSIFLSAPVDALLAGLRERHLRGGKDPQSMENHLRNVDLPDINLVLEFSKSADILVEKNDPLRIARIIYP